jgi:hypothetical protein
MLVPIFLLAYRVATFSRGEFRFTTNSSATVLYSDQVDLYSDELSQSTTGWSHLLNIRTGSSRSFPGKMVVLADDAQIADVLDRYYVLIDCPKDRQALRAPMRVHLLDHDSLETEEILDLPGRPQLWHEGRVMCTSDIFENGQFNLVTRIVEKKSPMKGVWETSPDMRFVALRNGYFLTEQPETTDAKTEKIDNVNLRHMRDPDKTIAAWQVNRTGLRFPIMKCSDEFILTLSLVDSQSTSESLRFYSRGLKLDIRELTSGVPLKSISLPREMTESNFNSCYYFPKHNRLFFSFNDSALVYDIAQNNTVLELDGVQPTSPAWYSHDFVCLRNSRDSTSRQSGTFEERVVRFLDIRNGELSEKLPEDGRFYFLAREQDLVTVEQNGQVELSERSSGKLLRVYRDHRWENYLRFALVVSLIAWEIAWINLGFHQRYNSLPTIACAILAVFIPVWMRVKFAGAESDPNVISNSLLTGLFTGLLVLTWIRLWVSKQRLSLRMLTFTIAIFLSSEVFLQRGLANTIRFQSTCITLLIIMMPVLMVYSWWQSKKRGPVKNPFGVHFRTVDMFAFIASVAILLAACLPLQPLIEIYLSAPNFNPFQFFFRSGGRDGIITGVVLSGYTLILLWLGRGRSQKLLRLSLGLAAIFIGSYFLQYSTPMYLRASLFYNLLWVTMHSGIILVIQAMQSRKENGINSPCNSDSHMGA